MRAKTRFRRAAAMVAAFASACVIESGPVDPNDAGGRPFVAGRWEIDAFVVSSSCGFVDDEFFTARVFQERDFLELVIDVAGFGDIDYEGVLERDGDFFLSQSTFFPDEGIRDESTVDGRFDFRGDDLTATETERVTDLVSGRSCRIVWRWRGERR